MSKAQELITLLTDKYGDDPRTLTAKEIRDVASDNGITSVYKVMNAGNKVAPAVYNFPPVCTSRAQTAKVSKPKKTKVAKITAPKQESSVSLSMETNAFSENLIPAKDDLFVPFGNFKTVRDIIKSRMFYPVFITGLSGNGKTYMVEQACAAMKREVIRVNFTVETDEDDLIGGFRLVDGDTKFFKGPLIKAMERGAVLLADEIDLANAAKVMCMQSILEGKGYFIKKTGEYITPAPGFNVIATANTKGKGSDDGRFIGTNILNEAFLERYPITCEQQYPSISIEKRILDKVAQTVNVSNDEFIQKLVDWADIIRRTFKDGGIDEVISTRRLVHIVQAYEIFGKRMKSIEVCTNRFDEETKTSFIELYDKIDENADPTNETT